MAVTRRTPSARAPVKTPIYLDYAATTPADPGVVAVMSRCVGADGVFGNPASRLSAWR